MRITFSAIIVLVLSSGLLAGCGQKGPLFLPGSPSEVQSVTQQSPQATQQDEEDDDEDRVPDR
jgi:predicted small lipoprotein YifL